MDALLNGSYNVVNVDQFSRMDSLAVEDELCVVRSDKEWIAYKVLCANSSILSIVGSTLVVFMVFRGRAGLSRLQNRVLFFMSIFEVIGSIGQISSTSPIPRGSNCTYGAIGNEGTCTIQGILITLGLIVPFYNAVLCVYYLLVIKYNTGDNQIAKYEPYMHLAAILPGVVVTIVASSASLFNNYSVMCWITEKGRYETNHDTSMNNSAADVLLIILSVFILVLAAAVIGVIVYCMINLYSFVREREIRQSTYRFLRPVTNNTNGNNQRRERSNLSNVVDDTKKQAYLYVGGFFLTYFFTTIMLMFDLFFDTAMPYPIMLCHGIFGPLQGFWNFLVYIRPRFNIISREYRDKNFLQRLYITVFEEQSNPSPAGTARTMGSRGRQNRRQQQELKREQKKRKKKAKKKSQSKSLVPSYRSPMRKKQRPKSPRVLLLGDGQEIDDSSGHSNLDIEIIDLENQASSDKFGDNISSLRRSHEQDEEYESCFIDEDDNVGPTATRPENVLDPSYREAVSISLLIAQDILPQSFLQLHDRNQRNEQRRRKSMIDIDFDFDNFHNDYGEKEVESTDKDAFSGFEEESLLQKHIFLEENNSVVNHPKKHRKLRRHSCPNLTLAQKD